MKCRNCGKKIPKNMKFCPECGAKIKRGRGVKIAVFILACVIAVLAGMGTAYYFLVLGNRAEKEADPTASPAASDIPAEEDKANVGDIKTDGPPALWLTVDTQGVETGKQSMVGFTVEVPDPSCESVTIKDIDNDKVLTTLTKKRKKDGGGYEFYGSYTFMPKESAFIQVRAFAGEEFSPVGYISVNEPASDDENEEFCNVVTGLGDYMDTLDKTYMSDSEILDAAEEWLKNNDSVADIVREENKIYYITTGGIEACYTTETPNRDLSSADSATDHYTDDTDATAYYDKWEDNHSALSRGRDEDINYLPADITITNNNTVLLRPSYYDQDGFDQPFFDDIKTMAEGSDYMDGGSFNDCRGYEDTLNIIKDKQLLDYGNIYIAAHGGSVGDFNNYCFGLMDTTDKNEWKNFIKNHKDIVTKHKVLFKSSAEKNQSWWIFCESYDGTYTDEQTGKIKKATHYRALLSARYIMNLYQNYKFDNALFWMISCHGMQDASFNDFLLNHGAQCMIGSEESVFFGVWEELANTVMKEMYEGENNESSKISSAWNTGVTNDICSVNSRSNSLISFEEYWKYYKNTHQKHGGKEKKEIESHTVGNYIADKDMIREYLSYKNPTWQNINIEAVYNNDVAPIAPGMPAKKAGSFDYSVTLANKMMYRVNNSDFTYGGEGALTGTVKRGRTDRTIHSDGTYEDAFTDEGVLSGANVTAYRYLNSGFVNKYESEYTDETVTDANGNFSLNNIDWGHYVLDTELADTEGEHSIILTDTSSGGEITVSDGTSSISGFVQGYSGSKHSNAENLSGADIVLKDAENNDELLRTTSGDDGGFELTTVPAGEYSLSISHNGYETLITAVSVDKGYTYKYDPGCFILENNESDNDIVLVLDVSGSMAGEAINAVQNAVNSFADIIIDNEENNCRVSIVTYSGSAETVCDFTKYNNNIYSVSSQLRASGSTNIEDGLSTAKSLLDSGNAKKKHIVLMSDGLPNIGKTGDNLVDYADTIKKDDVTIYTLGYFQDSSETNEGYTLMTDIASTGYRYNVSSTAELMAFFDDMAEQLNGTLFYNAEIECPVDVSVTYGNETLSSADDTLCTRTSFGTLMFGGSEEDRSKVLRLKTGIDYDIKITGTGSGSMNYTLRIPDGEGEYKDSRKFTGIPVTESLIVTTEANSSDYTILKLDNDGDGHVDNMLRAQANGVGEPYDPTKQMIIIAAICAGILAAVILIIIIIIKIRKLNRRIKAKRAEKTESKRRFCTNCGYELKPTTKFCEKCGKKVDE